MLALTFRKLPMPSATLRILETSDLHMELNGFDYFADSARDDRGLVHLATLIERERAKDGETLLFDNGDFLQGTPLADDLAARAETTAHPIVELLNQMKYDALTVGNHDLDYGLDYLEQITDAINAPTVCSNLKHGTAQHVFTPYHILEKSLTCDNGVSHPIKIGIVGVLPPQSVDWNQHVLPDSIQCDDIVDSVKAQIPHLIQTGADLIIALCHTGLGSKIHTIGMENALHPLSQIADIDVLLFGHTHQVFPDTNRADDGNVNHKNGTINSKPAVSAGSYARCLGKVELGLTHGREGWAITESKSSVIYLSDLNVDDLGKSMTSEKFHLLHSEMRQSLNKPLSKIASRATSYLTATGFDQTTRIVSDAMRKQVPNGLHDFPLIVAASPFRAGGRGGPANYFDFKVGNLTLRDAISMSPFNNPMCIVRRDGRQLRAWLAHCSKFYRKITPHGGPQNMLNEAFPSFNFDVLDGLEYSFYLSADVSDPARRIPKFNYNKRPIVDADIFYVAMSFYRAAGGGGLPKLTSDDIVWTSDIGMTDIVVSYIESVDTLPNRIKANWSFAPIAGASGTFISSPTAREVISDQPISWIKDKPDGFSLYELQF